MSEKQFLHSTKMCKGRHGEEIERVLSTDSCPVLPFEKILEQAIAHETKGKKTIMTQKIAQTPLSNKQTNKQIIKKQTTKK